MWVISITSYVPFTRRRASAFGVRSPMDDFVLEPTEREFLRALNELGVRYMIVGITAASMQGARLATEDIDLWFKDLGDRRVGDAARRVGGIWVPGHFGMQPP